MKCDLCSQPIEKTFLGKINGTVVKDQKGKKHTICPNCQRKTKNNKEAIIQFF